MTSFAIALALHGCTRSGTGPLPAPSLPPTATEARTAEARLSAASHDDLPPSAPHAIAHVSAGARLDRARVVVYLHGWEGCARAVIASEPTPCADGARPVAPWRIAALHDAAGAGTALVVPQLAWLARTGNPGRFREPDFAGAWARALLDELLRPELGIEAIDSVALVAHSGGYVTLRALLRADALPVTDVILLDALYGGADEIATWALADPSRRAVSVYTPHPDTTGQSHRLGRLVADAAGPDAVAIDPADPAEALTRARVVLIGSPHAHGAIPAQHLTELLSAVAR